MNHFVSLFQEIDGTTKTTEKVAALVRYFQAAPSQDVLWATALLIGNRPPRPIKPKDLRSWMASLTSLPGWLIDESYHTVGDLAETLAHLVPKLPFESVADVSLSVLMQALKDLKDQPTHAQQHFIIGFWQRHTVDENFIFNKLIAGNFRMGISRQLVIKALALFLEKEPTEVAHQLMGKWNPESETLETLFGENALSNKIYQPYPFFLAYPLEGNPEELLGPIEDWYVEKKMDGIRGQIIIRNHQLFVWSRGEELLTDKFPEFESLKNLLPNGTVLDGEIIPWKNGLALPFAVMQTRISRKKVSAKHLTEAPLVMVCYDLLEFQGMDLRQQPLWQRRQQLQALLASPSVNSLLLISPLLDFKNWEAANRFRADARQFQCEGVMIKRQNSIYETGRRKGNWWKWKTEPMTIDAVMIYAQSGSGRRSNLFTDYTFAVWDGDQLVPFTKAYSGLTHPEILQLDRWIKSHTIEKFGPVRRVAAEMVFEIAFEGIQESKRHKSGVALRFPRILRWRKDKPASEANTKSDLLDLLQSME